MKKRMKQSFLLLCTLLSLMLLAACGEKDTAVTVNLVNRSGHALNFRPTLVLPRRDSAMGGRVAKWCVSPRSGM